MTTTLLILSLLLTASFIGVAIWRERALPESISALVYVFRWKWLWTIWLWAVSLLTLIPAIDRLSRIGMEVLGFGTLACLMLCGAMPLFDKDNVSKHWTFGIAGCILSQLCVLVLDARWLLPWGVFIAVMAWTLVGSGRAARGVRERWVFLAEMVCYLSIIGSAFTTT